MDEATLVAPEAGLVTAVGVAVGDKVSAADSSGGADSSASSGASGMPSASSSSSASSSDSSSAAFTIVSTDSWTVDVSVGETDIDNVAKGEQVELTTDDGNQYFGTVSDVGLVPSTTSGSAQYPVGIAITGKGTGLFDGVSVDASIVYERRTDVLAVPSMAVSTSEGKSTVTVVDDDGEQSVTEVTVGETSGQYTEIKSGIDEGTTVLVATFTPSATDGSSERGGGQFPNGGDFPSGDFPSGDFPGGGQMPGGGSFPGQDGNN